MAQETESPAFRSKRPRQPFAWRFWAAFAIFMLLMIGGTFGVYWYNNIETYHLAPVLVGVLYRDGNRNLREFKHSLNFTHARTVVSLIDDQELNDPAKLQFLQETNYCTANGIQYIRIPVKLGGWPGSDDIKTFISIVNSSSNQPVLVHCAQGVRRTGMFVAAYQESVLRMSRQEAKDAILSFGHRQADTDDVRAFIDAYDPVRQTIPPNSRVGAE